MADLEDRAAAAGRRNMPTPTQFRQYLVERNYADSTIGSYLRRSGLHYGADQSVIALRLGHESVACTQIYVHADLRLEEKALSRGGSRLPPRAISAGDTLRAFLQAL
jgi:integrase